VIASAETISHTPHRIASVQKRLFAKLIDLLLVLFLGLVWWGGPGSILGFLYSITADAIPFQNWRGQSVGKKLMGIRVMSGSQKETKRNSMLKASIVRNAPVGLITFLMIIPFWGWILALLIGVPLGLIEISLMVRADRRQRLGDVMAESVVIDLRPERFHDHEPRVI
jgi:uncharacterized RDD family membrane protein YckC